MGSSEFKGYVIHCEFLSKLQIRQGKETVNGVEIQTDERPHYFAIRLKRSAIIFYRTISEDTRAMTGTQKLSIKFIWRNRQCSGRIARRVYQPGEKLTVFCCDLPTLALKATPRVY